MGGGKEGGREGRGKAQAYLEQHAHVLDKGHCDLDAVVRRLSQEHFHDLEGKDLVRHLEGR